MWRKPEAFIQEHALQHQQFSIVYREIRGPAARGANKGGVVHLPCLY
jgi:hypothetical protein